MLRVTGKEVEPEQTSREQPDTVEAAWGFGQPTLHLDEAPNRNMHKKLAQICAWILTTQKRGNQCWWHKSVKNWTIWNDMTTNSISMMIYLGEKNIFHNEHCCWMFGKLATALIKTCIRENIQRGIHILGICSRPWLFLMMTSCISPNVHFNN